MSKTISNAALGMYARLVGLIVSIPNQKGRICDLESDPFLGSALQGAASDIYHRYDTLLAPLTATLITLKHTRFEHCCPINSSYDGGGEYDDCGEGLA